MKYTPLTTSVITLTLLLGSAVPVFAEDAAPVPVDAGTTGPKMSETAGQGEQEGRKPFPGARFLGENRNQRPDRPDERGMRPAASTTDQRKADRADDRDMRPISPFDKTQRPDRPDERGMRPAASSSEQRKADREEGRVQKVQEKGGNAIDKRIQSLTELKARLASMKLIDPNVVSSISTSLDAEIAKLQTLKTQIGSDTSSTTLKSDVKSITEGLRIFAVVEPKARIAAAASRINAVVTQITSLETKLQTRIDEAKTAGVDTTSAVAALADLNAKIADAKIQADSAVSMTAGLVADNGDATVRASNLQALKDARAKLVLAEKDLADARRDAGTIRSLVKGTGANTPAPTTSGN